jgi:tRNA(fMet)-specific endonuclease VapC
LINGAKKSHYVEDNVRRLNALSELIEVLTFDKKAAMVYGDVRSDLEKRGLVIGSNDLFIVAHAMSLGLTLVTNNQREFSRVNGLKIENWVEDESGPQ